MSQAPSLTAKPLSEWATGEEPMTGRQSWYLKSLCEKTGEGFKPDWTKAEASRMIERLKPVVAADDRHEAGSK